MRVCSIYSLIMIQFCRPSGARAFPDAGQTANAQLFSLVKKSRSAMSQELDLWRARGGGRKKGAGPRMCFNLVFFPVFYLPGWKSLPARASKSGTCFLRRRLPHLPPRPSKLRVGELAGSAKLAGVARCCFFFCGCPSKNFLVSEPMSKKKKQHPTHPSFTRWLPLSSSGEMST